MFNKGGKKVSRSFTVSLDQFTLGLPIGSSDRVLERNIDVLDVMSILLDEGFSYFDRPCVYHKMHGRDYDNLRNLTLSKLVGVPRDAYVEMSYMGESKRFLSVKLTY